MGTDSSTPDMNIALAKDSKLRPQVLKLLGDIKAKSPMDSASPEVDLHFKSDNRRRSMVVSFWNVKRQTEKCSTDGSKHSDWHFCR